MPSVKKENEDVNFGEPDDFESQEPLLATPANRKLKAKMYRKPETHPRMQFMTKKAVRYGRTHNVGKKLVKGMRSPLQAANDKKIIERQALQSKSSEEWKTVGNSGLDQTAEGASSKWFQFINRAPYNTGWSPSAESIAAGRLRKSQGFHAVKYSHGSIAPYYVEHAILRGGGTRRGHENAQAGTFAIQTAAGTRQLKSLQAKYTDPTLFPSTRIIKFIRGYWGAKREDPHTRLRNPIKSNATIWPF